MSQRPKSRALDFLTDAVGRLQHQFQLLLDTRWIQILLENEQVAFLVENDELRFGEGYDTVEPD